MRQNSGIGVLDKAITVLHAVAESPCGLADLCERSGYCSVHGLWQRVRDAVVEALDAMTLAELAEPRFGHPVHADPVFVAVRPLSSRTNTTKESIAQP